MEEASVEIDWSAEVAKARAEAHDAVRARPAGGGSRRAEARREEFQAPPGADPMLDLDKLYTEENMESLVQILPEFMLATTGHPHWQLSDKEVKRLSTTGAATARVFLRTDPKWIVLALFLTNTTIIYGKRFLLDLQMYRKEQAEKDNGQRQKTP